MRLIAFYASLMSLILLSACGGGDTPAPTDSPPDTSPPTNVPAQAINDPNAVCPDFVQQALVETDSACDITGRNQACYGNVMIELNPDSDNETLQFSSPGDIIDIADIETLRLQPLNLQDEIWGVVLMRLQANLSDTTPGQGVTFLMFGDVEFENRSPNADTNINSFYFTSGIGDAACASAPESGLLIQTPDGVGKVDLAINEVAISIGSTAYLQAQPDANMTVNVIEGQAEITAEGETQTINAGNRTTIGLNADGIADSPPSPPEPYDVQPLRHLPVQTLPRPVTIEETIQTGDFTPVGFEISNSIDADGEIDVFEFDAVAGQAIFVDVLSAPVGPTWALHFERPDNADLEQENETRVSAIPLLDSDLGYFELPETGTYQIVVKESNETFGAYEFKVWDVPPPEQMELQPVANMEDEHLGMGKGQIETPGVVDEYQLEVSAGQTIYFDGMDSDSGIRWNIYGADDEQVVTLNYNVSRDLESITFPEAGQYTVRIWGEGDTVGTYSFQLWNVPPIAQLEFLELDNPAIIGGGAGDIETPGVIDEYTLEVTAGQTVYFDGVESDPAIRWNIYDSDNTPLITLNYNVSRDLESITFPEAGQYTIRIWGQEDAVGLYTFQLWDVPPVNTLTFTIPDDAHERVIGAGSGDIETPGVIDEYPLEVTAGQTLYFDGMESDSGIRWNIYGVDDEQVVTLNYNVSRDLESITFETAGTYTIRIWGQEDTTGMYSFQLWNVPPVTTLDLTDGIGLGDIETPGVIDEYPIEVTAGQTLYFDGMESDSGIRWNIYDSDNISLITLNYNVSRDLENITFEAAGTYTIRIWGQGDTAGTYAFEVRERDS